MCEQCQRAVLTQFLPDGADSEQANALLFDQDTSGISADQVHFLSSFCQILTGTFFFP